MPDRLEHRRAGTPSSLDILDSVTHPNTLDLRTLVYFVLFEFFLNSLDFSHSHAALHDLV